MIKKHVIFFIMLFISIFFSVNIFAQTEDLKTYSKFDFVPGNKVLFFDDFSETAIGDFPVSWNTNSSGEVIQTNLFPGKWLMMNEEANFYLLDGLKVDKNFTIEFDVFFNDKEETGCESIITLFELNEEDPDLYANITCPGKCGIEFSLVLEDTPTEGAFFRAYDAPNNKDFDGKNTKSEARIKKGEVAHISIWVQNTRMRLYVNQTKVFDVQRAFLPNAKIRQFRIFTGYSCLVYMSNFRVADASEDNRSKLLTEGKIISYGIYFDSGKDKVKPESYGALKEIATILKDNPDLKIIVVGHTDSDGNEKSNLDLSKRRAANVKNALISEFSIASDRIDTDGKGQSEPIEPNTSVENKAKNRRVEFIKK